VRWALAACLFLTAVGPWARGQGNQQLVVENRSRSDAEISTWRYDGSHWDWVTITTVRAGYRVPISDVRQDDRFRAYLRDQGDYRYHTVALRDTAAGRQDEWRIE
jgi:hypothetical protein